MNHVGVKSAIRFGDTPMPKSQMARYIAVLEDTFYEALCSRGDISNVILAAANKEMVGLSEDARNRVVRENVHVAIYDGEMRVSAFVRKDDTLIAFSALSYAVGYAKGRAEKMLNDGDFNHKKRMIKNGNDINKNN